jgi:hypothetical protein
MAPAEKIVNPDEDMSGENKEFINAGLKKCGMSAAPGCK